MMSITEKLRPSVTLGLPPFDEIVVDWTALA